MTDETTEYGPPRPGVFDDDRLLACALGLEDDAELLEAAVGDAALADRLAAMRRDIATIGEQVRSAVPAPDEEYVDLADARWAGLRPYLEPAARSRGRASRWLRVAAPLAAVVALALVAGLVALDRGGDVAMQDAGRAVTEEAGGQLSSAATAPTFAEQVDDFAVVVLARARAASGALQRFAVLRVYKGDAPRVLELDVGETPAVRGRLHLLMLRPLATVTADVYGVLPSQQPEATKGAGDGPGRELAVDYAYDGEPVVCRELPPDTDPMSVTMP
jgi:hypothetical protein